MARPVQGTSEAVVEGVIIGMETQRGANDVAWHNPRALPLLPMMQKLIARSTQFEQPDLGATSFTTSLMVRIHRADDETTLRTLAIPARSI